MTHVRAARAERPARWRGALAASGGTVPTIGHAAIGFAAARAHAREPCELKKHMVAYGTLAVLPDLDLLATVLNHPSVVPLGHRGATHSLLAAAALAAVFGLLGPRASRLGRTLTAFVVVASHGLIDPLNAGSMGTAYFWPFSSARLTWGNFHPIPVTPVGLEVLYGVGLQHLVIETLLFSPLLVYAFWPRARRVEVLCGDTRQDPIEEPYEQV
jgi:inner membrane protein